MRDFIKFMFSSGAWDGDTGPWSLLFWGCLALIAVLVYWIVKFDIPFFC
jgi:hypothetical protein